MNPIRIPLMLCPALLAACASRAPEPDPAFALHCPGSIGTLHVRFVNTEPNLAYLSLGADGEILLSQQPSGSGARYTGKDDQGEYEFWNKGDQALLTRPGSAAVECTLEPIG